METNNTGMCPFGETNNTSPFSKWSKYNIKSNRPPRGKQGSSWYEHLVKAYGSDEADKLYKKYKYHVNNGQKDPKG